MFAAGGFTHISTVLSGYDKRMFVPIYSKTQFFQYKADIQGFFAKVLQSAPDFLPATRASPQTEWLA